MSRTGSRELTACLDPREVSCKEPEDVAFVVKTLKEGLTRKLGKKNVSMSWQDSPEAAKLRLRLMHVDRGNRFLRWVFLFLGGATVEVEGEQVVADGEPRRFRCERTAAFTLGFMFGGSVSYMLGTCCDRLIGDITRRVLEGMKAGQ